MIQPLGTPFEIESCARAHAAKHRLIDDTGQLHCWNCGGPCAWHVSLHCYLCKAESLRTAPDRRRKEYEDRKAEDQRAADQSRPQQRAVGRSFRDGY